MIMIDYIPLFSNLNITYNKNYYSTYVKRLPVLLDFLQISIKVYINDIINDSQTLGY